jgi:sugar transferase EpsL
MHSIYKQSGKRLLDLISSFASLMLLSPFIIVIGLLIYQRIGFPVIFKQVRPGLNEKPFSIFKFRTMTNEHDANGGLLPDCDRLTRFGKFLRSISVDELPELFNVLKGEMSIVGPRPLLMQYLDLYTTEQARRHNVKPGLTGWAQVNGRNAISWEEKFKLDVWYVDNISFLLDLKIIFLTIWKIIIREGINKEGHATMEAFVGTKPEK